MSNRLKILSLGAGVQSSALLLMMNNGDIEKADCAIFADTQSEPQEVYDWLEKLKEHSSIPIYVRSAGNLAQDMIDHFHGKKNRVGQIPLYAKSGDGKKGMLRRHCTYDYKIQVVDKFIREYLGYKPRFKIKHEVSVYIGISFDEMERMKLPQQKWKKHIYPLVERGLRRQDCIDYVNKFGIGKPPRSACFMCPYKSNSEWQKIKDNPIEWKRAVEFDRKIRKSVTPGLTSEFFVHRDLKPLDEVVLDNEDFGQMSMLDECDGMCGV